MVDDVHRVGAFAERKDSCEAFVFYFDTFEVTLCIVQTGTLEVFPDFIISSLRMGNLDVVVDAM